VEKIPYNIEAAAAEVVGSNPTRSISFYEETTVLFLSLILTIVGQKP
jgi:hypothetical protein